MSLQTRLAALITEIGQDIKDRPKILILEPADPLPDPLPSDGTIIFRKSA